MNVFFIIVGVAILFGVFRAIKIIPSNHSGIIYRFGRPITEPRKPGLHFVAPFVDRMVLLPDQPTNVSIPALKLTTSDPYEVQVIATLQYRIQDPFKALNEVADFASAMVTLSENTLRSKVQSVKLTDLLSERGMTNSQLLESLKVTSEKWGIRVTEFEISSVEISEDLRQELERKAQEERRRRRLKLPGQPPESEQ